MYSYKQRIKELKDRIISTPHEICIERAFLFTESYKSTRGKSPVFRFAKAMDHFLSNMTIRIWENEYLIGNRTTKFVGTPLFPEIRVDTIEQDLNTYETRFIQQLKISEEDKKVLKEEIIPYWKNNEETLHDRFLSYLEPDLKSIIDKLLFTVEVQFTNGIGHFFPGHHNVFKYGFNGLIDKVSERLNNLNIDDPDYSEKYDFLNSTLIILIAVKNFIKRFANLAKKKARLEIDELRKTELEDISQICDNISENPPDSFKEALQLIYFNQLICGLEDGGFGISVGRLDQDLYPFYKQDILEHKISNEEVRFLLKCFYIKLTSLWNYIFALGANAGEGPPLAENLTIGGLDKNGNDATNELSYLILEAYKELKTVQPTFSIRIHSKTENEFLENVYKAIKSGTSLALFNDDLMISSLMERGFSLQDAREYAPIGCVEPQHPYKSFGSTNSNQFNIVKCLELALNNGIDLFSRKQYGKQINYSIDTYSDLWNAFKVQVVYFIKKMTEAMYFLDKAIAELTPQPFLSTTTDNCIEHAKDVTRGGAIYNFTGPQLIGLATVADSLAVIKKIVFEDKLLKLEELTQILKKNFRGTYKNKRGKEWRSIFINKVPKFGNDEDYVDNIAKDIAKLFCDTISKHNNYRGGKFNPGIYSTSLHLAFGAFTGASADGRKSRDPLSNGVGPTHGRDKLGPTAILNSVKKLRNDLMTNGNSLIIAFHPNSMKMETFLPLIKAYFEKEGGFQIQFNVVGKETLCKAQLNPENYKGLVVRIAGYSVYFTELSKAAQDEIIARTEY
ncbi:MAG: formate C-acetyltransferase/glycerol dehydratase family glycyl radical enzyme [Candidatus Lokiarchaeota archaeon]|nr:formate C-acetyltransferase/glycerol dehydratase family glycyl radical enzyme [Candidatus Lokiarchaeota archaeon]MBD3199360.1 formate C-acetyltransferase/glycerol dehydratase family glycyl radical enzyme [Candidatus Lokiarchaeota archaeon]